MEPNQASHDTGDRVAVIAAVKTYLGFFVLVVLVVEAVFGALALTARGSNQLFALSAMLFVVAVLITLVAFFAYRKPDVLLRSINDQAAGTDSAAEDFVAQIAGDWWERIQPSDSSALSFVEIRPDPATNTAKMKGSAYTKDGRLDSVWESTASCVNAGEHRLFYYWRGWHTSRPNEPYEGFGEVSFRESSGTIGSALGFFSDTNLTDMKSTTKKSTELRRCTETEEGIMRTGESRPISDLIRMKLG